MKQKLTFFFILCIVSGCLAGCEKTPEDPVVREKGVHSQKAYESAGDRSGGTLREARLVPGHVTDRAVYEEGKLVIDTDADVTVPDVDAASTYGVSAKKGGQEMVDLVTGVFFPDAKFYHTDGFYTLTKDECQEKITELKKYRSEGKDENGGHDFDLDSLISQYEELLDKAPKEKVLEEIKPSFGLEYVIYDDNDKPKKEVLEDLFYGVAVTEDGEYDYSISYGRPDMQFTIEKNFRGVAGPFEPVYRVSGEELLSGQEEADVKWDEGRLKKFVDIPFEKAKKAAEEKAGQLGMGLAVYGWDYQLFYRGNDVVQESNILDGGYVFYFTRMVDGIPLTYTDVWGGGVEEMESTLDPWGYEICNIVVGSDGVYCVELRNPYEIGEVKVKNVQLLDFDEVMQIYAQMMEVSMAGFVSDENFRTCHITRITLGYSRIYDPMSDNSAGTLVPVWDFFGSFDVGLEDTLARDSQGCFTRSLLTINAIDGTVIDRELGY